MHVRPVVELQTATVSMGTVTATLATLVPMRQIAPATRATLEITVRWMTVSVKQSQHYCYALYHVYIHVATQRDFVYTVMIKSTESNKHIWHAGSTQAELYTCV